MDIFYIKLQQQLDTMMATGKLFRSTLTGQEVWDTYLNSFPPEDNPIFRDPESSVHNCNFCKNWVRRYGNLISVNEMFEVTTLWDVETDGEFKQTAEALTKLIKSAGVSEVFFETYAELNSLPYESCSKSQAKFQLGVAKNVKRYTKEEAEKYGVVQPNEIRTFEHIHCFLDKQFVDQSGKSAESLMGQYRDAKKVFQRTMEEIPLDTLNLVRDLINQGSLLDGQTHLYKVEAMIPLKAEYDNLSVAQRDNWCWVKSYGFQLAKFKNELIGVLCTELAEGEELNKACQAWNKRVDPANYMKAVAPITKRQIEEARKFVEENGYEQSFDRRMATMDDIKISEILHANVGDGKIKSVSIFDSIKSTSTRHKRSEFDGVEEVPIEKFMKDILPGCTSVEAFLTNQHEGNMVSLTTSADDNSKPIFKWSNNYSSTFNGNLAGKSQIKQNVKSAGGKIDGVLRCSLQWNDDDTKGIVDFDLHCTESKGQEIHHGNRRSSYTGGRLDVDMIRPSMFGIENITWQQNPKDMQYKFRVKNFCGGRNSGFKVEIEFDGNVFNYHYQQNATGFTNVATVTVKDGQMSIEHHLSETSNSKEIYGLESNQFHKVNLLCLSPNHWGENQVGNKHYFFMLEGCKAPTSIRSFHNENLLPELAQHRKVLEVLGATNQIESTDKQLSGLGFNATVRDELIVRLQGSHKRTIKIRFN
jgi:hypothetical protein